MRSLGAAVRSERKPHSRLQVWMKRSALPFVAWRVGSGADVTSSEAFDRRCEDLGDVTRAVIGHDPPRRRRHIGRARPLHVGGRQRRSPLVVRWVRPRRRTHGSRRRCTRAGTPIQRPSTLLPAVPMDAVTDALDARQLLDIQVDELSCPLAPRSAPRAGAARDHAGGRLRCADTPRRRSTWPCRSARRSPPGSSASHAARTI